MKMHRYVILDRECISAITVRIRGYRGMVRCVTPSQTLYVDVLCSSGSS